MKLPRDVSGDDPLRIGTLAAVLDDVAEHFGISRNELIVRIDI